MSVRFSISEREEYFSDLNPPVGDVKTIDVSL